jgi:acetoin utilization deacetylase AcuC-like enzyme
MTVLFATHPLFLRHDTGPGHPERPQRLQAVLDGVAGAGLDEVLVDLEPRPATRAELEAVHPAAFIDRIEAFCAQGGGHLDGDTVVSAESYDAAVLAAGTGLSAIDALDQNVAGAASAFCAARPPGHHARVAQAMGFCLFNTVAVAAAALADRGERVLVVDYDVHHGNGTQDIFYADPRVLYVSLHEWPLYPGTGALDETGTGAGAGMTVNFPLPAGATGDVYRAAIDDVLAPIVAEWSPTWLLVSAGFDAHRADPLAGIDLAAGDYADMTAALLAFVPEGRRIVFLEGGYDLGALTNSTTACLGAMAGVDLRPEPSTSGGPGRTVVDAVAERRAIAADRA